MKAVVAIFVLLSVALQPSASCPSGQYECHDNSIFVEYCVSDSALCDGTKQCPEGDDEDNCPSINVGLAVGLAIGGFILFIIAPFIVCIIIVCCCVGVCSAAGSNSRNRTTVVHHAAPAAPQTTVVSSNNSNMIQQAYNPVPTMPMNPPAYHVKPGQYQPGPPAYPM